MAKRLSEASKREMPGLGENRGISVGEAGVETTWRNSHALCGWQDLTALTQERGFLIFWSGHRAMIVLPRRALTAAEMETVLRLAKARIAPRS
jgi:hypothetical protein